jgi:hypothetical protein
VVLLYLLANAIILNAQTVNGTDSVIPIDKNYIGYYLPLEFIISLENTKNYIGK